MNKFLIAAIGLVFLLGSSATMAILNQMGCDGKKAGEKIRDRVDGEMVTCPAKIKQPNFGK